MHGNEGYSLSLVAITVSPNVVLLLLPPQTHHLQSYLFPESHCAGYCENTEAELISECSQPKHVCGASD